jgi:hypothetical protein
LVLQKINKIDKPIACLTGSREKTQINKIRDKKANPKQVPMKSKGSLGNISKTHIQKN